MALHKVFVKGIRLAPVNETGHFIQATLLDVPEYLQCSDIELILNTYGSVAHIKKEYFEYQGFQLENETRHVLFSYLVKDLPEIIVIDGFEVCVNYVPQARTRTMYGVDDLITQPANIPKHVMETVQKTMAKSDVRDKSRILSHSRSQLKMRDYKSQDSQDSIDRPFKKMSVSSTGAAEVQYDPCVNTGESGQPERKSLKTLSLADLPHGEDKDDFTAKYDKELETLSLISRSPSFSEKDSKNGSFFPFQRRPSLDQEIDEREKTSKQETLAALVKSHWREQDPETKL